VIAARQMGFIATPVESAVQALTWLSHGSALIPDLILFDDAELDTPPPRFAVLLTETLGDLAPPVIYIVRSTEVAETLTSPPIKAGHDVVLHGRVTARDVLGAILLALRCSTEERSVLRAEGLELDTIGRMLTYRGRNVHLTRFEFRFMEYIMRRSGQLVTNDELLDQVWGFEPGTGAAEVIRAHVRNLRRKLDLLGVPRDVIWTVPGRGYFFAVDR
jgi:DNA-binding response OmpR family regulator